MKAKDIVRALNGFVDDGDIKLSMFIDNDDDNDMAREFWRIVVSEDSDEVFLMAWFLDALSSSSDESLTVGEVRKELAKLPGDSIVYYAMEEDCSRAFELESVMADDYCVYLNTDFAGRRETEPVSVFDSMFDKPRRPTSSRITFL